MLRINHEGHTYKIWWYYPDKKNPLAKKPETQVYLVQSDVENPILNVASVRKSPSDKMSKSEARRASLEKVLAIFDRSFRSAVWTEYWKVVKD